MLLNNSFNILPWYDSVEKQSSKKWYAFGQSWPLLCPQGVILPFQFISSSAFEITSNIFAVDKNTGDSIDLGVTPTITAGTQAGSSYYVVKNSTARVPVLPIGTYYLRFNTSIGYLYSEEIAIIDDANTCLKIEYWNEDTLYFTSGEINFADDFKFEFYIRSTIGKPEYEFEEELTKRLGYKFIESQTSNKLYKFAFAAPEYICDAMRLIRLCDYIKITTAFDSYNALSFAYEPKWQDQGDLASVEVEFDTDCIIQKLESFNRRLKESFYNALLADIDEPVLFSSDTVAQYYTEFTTTSFINGKLIRQLEAVSARALKTDLANIVIPVDNQADSQGEAKKVFLQDILGLVDTVSKLFKGHYDEAGNLIWIEALSNIGVNGSITMNIDNGTITLPSIFESLPIDGITLIRDENGVLMLNPDINFGGSGVSDFWDLNNIPAWITSSKPVYQYSEIQGTPDLSIYAKSSDVDTRINDLINGAPAAYDTLKEIADVLQGNVNSIGDIISTLGEKANKATTLAGYNISDAKISRGTITLGEETITPLTSHQTIYALTLQAGAFSAGTYTPNSGTKTINIPTTTAHISESGNLYFTNARAVSALSSTLASYVTLGGSQTITGAKNFTGGLSINGGSLVYNASKGYWKLEGNLLVTGGVSMYNSGNSDIPSGGGGGSIDYPLKWSGFSSGSFDGSAAKTIYIPSKLSELTNDSGYALSSALSGYLPLSGGTMNAGSSIQWAAQNGKKAYIGQYATDGSLLISIEGNSTNHGLVLGATSGNLLYKGVIVLHATNYAQYALPLTGGTLTSTSDTPLVLKRNATNSSVLLKFINSTETLGYIGVIGQSSHAMYKQPVFGDNVNVYQIIHSGNIGSQSVSYASNAGNADKLGGLIDSTYFAYRGWDNSPGKDANTASMGCNFTYANNAPLVGPLVTFACGGYDLQFNASYDGGGKYVSFRVKNGDTGRWHDWKTIATTESNVASATKLQTPRTIWGQSFDGTGNVNGVLTLGTSHITGNDGADILNSEGQWCYLGGGTSEKGFTTFIDGFTIRLRYGTSHTEGVRISSSGNVGIGTTTPEYKLDVNGSIKTTGSANIGGGLASLGNYTKYNSDKSYRLMLMHIENGARIYNIADDGSVYGDMGFGLSTGKRLYIKGDTGYVGINTLSPSAQLHVDGNIYGTGNLTLNGNETISGTLSVNGKATFTSSDGVSVYNDVSIGGNAIFANNRGICIKNTSGTSYDVVRISGSNNLIFGVGSTDGGMNTYLDGNNIYLRYGSSHTTGITLASDGQVTIAKYTTIKSGLFANSLELSMATPFIDFHFNSSTADYTSRIIEESSGELTCKGKWKVGGALTASSTLSVSSTSTFTGKTTHNGGIGATSGAFSSTLSVTSTTVLAGGATIGKSSSDNGTYKLHVTGSAYISSNLLTGGSITMNSMRSMKNIINENGLSLEELSTIKPTRFTWKDGRDDRIHVGGIADDVMKVLPEVVFKGSDGVLSMDYASAAFVMAASLIQPMTEHERRIANLERENALLKEEIRNLKSA